MLHQKYKRTVMSSTKKEDFFTYYWQQKLFFLRTTVKQKRTACEFGPPQHYCSHFKMVCRAPGLHLTACYAPHVPVSEASSPRTEPGIVRTHPRLSFSDPLQRMQPFLKSILEGSLSGGKKIRRREENFQEKLLALAILCLTNVFQHL